MHGDSPHCKKSKPYLGMLTNQFHTNNAIAISSGILYIVGCGCWVHFVG